MSNPIFKDSIYCQFQLEWYGLDMLFTFEDYHSGIITDWFKANTLGLFGGTNTLPFKIVNVTFNPNKGITPYQQEELEQRLMVDWADSYNPLLAINQSTNQYLLVAPYALMMFPKYFEGWLIVPTSHYSSFAVILEYFNLKDITKCSTVGELMIDSYLVNFNEEYDTALIRQHKALLSKVRSINLDTQNYPNPYVREFNLFRRKTFQFVKHLFNPDRNYPQLEHFESSYNWYKEESNDHDNELELFEYVLHPFIPKLELFEEKIRDSNLLYHLNQSMNTQHKLKFLE
jgi:hypothetical protein